MIFLAKKIIFLSHLFDNICTRFLLLYRENLTCKQLTVLVYLYFFVRAMLRNMPSMYALRMI